MIQERENYSASYRRFVLVMLTIVYAFNFIDRQILVILQEAIKADMGLSDVQLGLLSGFSFAVIYVTAGIPIAYWADRGNRRNIVALSLSVWSGMTAISGLAQNYLQLLLARIGVGLGEAGGSPPSHSMISDYYPEEHRGKALSFYSTGIYVGILVGYLFGGILAQSFGWRVAFFVVGIPGVLFAILLRFTIKEPVREHKAGDRSPSLAETLSVLKQRPSFWLIAVATGFLAFVQYGVGNFLPSFLIRMHGMSISEVGAVLAPVAGIMGGIGTFLGGYFADRFGRNDKRWYLRVALISGALAIPMYMGFSVADSALLSVAFLAIANLFMPMYLGPCIATCHMVVPPRMRALSSAILFFALNIIGLGVGPVFTGFISDSLASSYGERSIGYALLITAQVGIVGLLLFFLAIRRLTGDLEKQANSGAA